MEFELCKNESRKDELALLETLRSVIASYGSALVAISGGMDSTLVLKIAHDELRESAVAFTARSPLMPSREIEETVSLVRTIGTRHIIREIDPLSASVVRSNLRDRCYHCKTFIYREALAVAEELGLKVLADGTSADDYHGNRPGLRAIRELGVRSPLAEAHFSRSDVVLHSRDLGLPSWNKPSQSCLATRIPYGVELDEKILKRVDRCEQGALALGFTQVRARVHGQVLRLEFASQDMDKLGNKKTRDMLIGLCKEVGFAYVTVDLEGFRSGSMDLM